MNIYISPNYNRRKCHILQARTPKQYTYCLGLKEARKFMKAQTRVWVIVGLTEARKFMKAQTRASFIVAIHNLTRFWAPWALSTGTSNAIGYDDEQGDLFYLRKSKLR